MLKKAFRENELHRWLERFPVSPLVEAGIGHDTAVTKGAGRLILKADQLVEGVHFERRAPARLAGRKALNRALSDCAAAGGVPRFALASLALPASWNQKRVRDFLLGVREAGEKQGVSLVGGDLSRASKDFVASIAVVGFLEGAKPPGLRSRAREGDALLVTGRLGGSILGKHLRFQPRLAEGQRLRARYRVGAIMDLSDGLAMDLPRLCRSSGVGAVIESAAVPISPSARRLSRRSRRQPLWHALCDGEDYELLWSAAPRQAQRMLRDPVLRRAGVTKIGIVTRGREVSLRDGNGRLRPFPRGGYEHAWV